MYMKTKTSFFATTAMALMMALPSFADTLSAQGKSATSTSTQGDLSATSGRLRPVEGVAPRETSGTLRLNTDSQSEMTLSEPGFTATPTNLSEGGDNLGDHTAIRNLDLSAFRIVNLAPPEDGSDAVNRDYVDFATSGARDNLGNHIATQFLSMEGYPITNLPFPLSPTSAANRAYVDSKVAEGVSGAAYFAGDGLSLSTSTFSVNASVVRNFGIQEIGGAKRFSSSVSLMDQRLLDVGAPEDVSDGVNKGYVDGALDAAVTIIEGDIEALANRRVDTGVGLLGGGDLTQNRTLSFDQAWGDGRYAQAARRIDAGTGLIGGGTLQGDRTLSFDMTFGDGRYALASRSITAGDGLSGGGNLSASRTISVDGSVVRTSGTQSIAGAKTFTGDVSFGNRVVQGLSIPLVDTDAANKAYVDTQIGSISGADVLTASNGVIRIGDELQADVTVVRTTGAQTIGGAKTFTSVANFSDQRVTRVGNPTQATDAVNKSYVDTLVAGSAYSAGDGLLLAGSTFSVDPIVVVRTSGAQTIGGAKTFSSTVTAPRVSATTAGGFRAAVDTPSQPSFTWGGDLDSGIYSANPNEVGIATGGSTRLTAHGAGVHVEGALAVRSDGAATMLSLRDSADVEGGIIYHSAADDLLMRLYATGTSTTRAQILMSQSGDITATHGRWAGNGAGLTDLDAGRLETGTVPRARLTGTYDVSVTGNAATATVLRNPRTLTVGNTGKTFDGSGPVSWTLGEIGALPLTGGTLTGGLNISMAEPTINFWDANGSNGRIRVANNEMSFVRASGDLALLKLNFTENKATFGKDVFAQAYFYSSDRNLKEDIATIEGASGLDIVNRVRPVSYNWISDGRKAMGVIAQEVEEIIPEMVSVNGQGTKAVDYIQFIAPMLAAIQDLDDRVIALEAAR
jgi:hypothetical protein